MKRSVWYRQLAQQHGFQVQYYLRVLLRKEADPTGEGSDDPGVAAASRRWNDSGAYEENFMGIIIDADRLAQDYEDGVPLEQLVKRPPLPPGMTPWDMHRP